jgi:osmotically-inducible protein OsmY
MKCKPFSTSLVPIFLAATTLVFLGCSGGPSDSQLTSNVQKTIAADNTLQGQPISVAAKDGTVTLTGAVNTPNARSTAAGDAAQVKGVKTVVNDLNVDSAAVQAAANAPAPNSSASDSDNDLAANVKKKIAGDSALRGENISVSAKDGVVTLGGAVNGRAARELASRDASQVDGVRTVINDLTTGRAAAAAAAPRSSAPASAAAAAPAAASQPASIVVPSGTPIRIQLGQTLSSNGSQTGQPFSGTVASSVMAGGETAIPAGSRASGIVTQAKGLGHIKGEAELALRLDTVTVGGQRYPVTTSRISRVEKGKGKRTAILGGGGAGLGALIGGLTGGGKGAAIGALVGGAGGTAGSAFTGNKNIVLPAETVLTFTLENSVTINQYLR